MRKSLKSHKYDFFRATEHWRCWWKWNIFDRKSKCRFVLPEKFPVSQLTFASRKGSSELRQHGGSLTSFFFRFCPHCDNTGWSSVDNLSAVSWESCSHQHHCIRDRKQLLMFTQTPDDLCSSDWLLRDLWVCAGSLILSHVWSQSQQTWDVTSLPAAADTLVPLRPTETLTCQRWVQAQEENSSLCSDEL